MPGGPGGAGGGGRARAARVGVGVGMVLVVLVMALGLGLLVMIRTGSPRLLRAEPFRALVAPKMVMGQVGVLRVKEGTTTSVASTSLGHPQSVMDPLAKVCPHLLPVSRWTLTIYL